MIVVSLKHSYPNLVDDVRSGQAQMVFARLEGITRGDWPKISAEKLEGFLDFVVGTFNDMIVTAYPIARVTEGPDDTIRFEGPEQADGFSEAIHSLWSSNASRAPGEWLVGCPMPGGNWKRGEARGTRRYLLADYLEDHPDLAERQREDMGSRMALNLLEHFATGKSIHLDDYPQLTVGDARGGQAATPATGVTVVRQPGGTVVITIPTGTRAQVLIEPAGA